MRDVDLLVAESRNVGVRALAAPVLVWAVVVVLGLTSRAVGQASADTIGLVTVRVSSIAVPLAMGLAASAVAARERMLELHLTVSVPLLATVLRRQAVLLAGGWSLAIAAIATLRTCHVWNHPAPLVAAPVLALAPALLLMAVGAAVGLRLRSAAGAAVAVVVAWLVQVQIFSRFGEDWIGNRLAVAALGLAVGLPLLAGVCQDRDRLMQGGS